MNEIVNGNEREVTYTVRATFGEHETQEVTDPAEAAKAFHAIPGNDRPDVIRAEYGPGLAPGGSAQLIASTTGIGESLDSMQYSHDVGNADPAFAAAYNQIARKATEADRATTALGKQIKSAAEKDDGPDERRASVGIEARQMAHANAMAVADTKESVLSPEVSRVWAELDAREFRKLSDPSRIEDAALFMQTNSETNIHYNIAMRQQAPEVAEVMEAMQTERAHRVSLKEAGKATDAEVMAARDADAFEIPRHSAQETNTPEITKSPEEALQSLIKRNGQAGDIEAVPTREATTQARADQADYAQLDAAGKSEAARLLVGNFKNREYAAEFARHDPEAAQEVIRNSDGSRNAPGLETIERSNRNISRVMPNALGEDEAIYTVERDVAALKTIQNADERYVGALAIAGNATDQVAYRDVLAAQAPEVLSEANQAQATMRKQLEALTALEPGAARASTAAELGRQMRAHSAVFDEVHRNSHDVASEALQAANNEKSRDAQVGTPMKSMPGSVMVYNDQPGMRGADILTADGKQISFGGPEAIEAYAKENNLAAEDVAVLKALDAQADKHRTPNIEDLPAMDIDPLARAGMEKNRAKEMAAVRDSMGDQGTAITGDAAAKTPTTDKQVAELDARMEKAKLEELGWRDRDDISDVMRDLEKLAAKDWQVAADLWQKYRPNDIDKPVFIDGDDIDEKRPSKASTRDDTRGVDGGKEEAAGVVTPDALRKRFLQAENKFYFRDDENKLAFEDKGKRLATEHNDPEIARSMVELAQAKGWSTIKLKGTDEFKREVWLQASLKGMDVQGYKPLDVDLARLEDLRKETGRNADHGRNIIDQVPERSKAGDRAERTEAVDKTAVVDENTRTLSKRQLSALETIKGVMRARGDSETAVNMAAELAAERFQTNRVYVGKVVDHGAAPYENDPKNERSYYVKLQTDAGEKIVWGVDLERAVGDGKAQVGDDVALAYQGKQPVTVPVKEYDDKGKVVGVSEITTNRNTWDVRRLETVREEVKEKLAEAARKADRQPLVKVYDRDAERTTARPEVVREQRAKDNERAHGARG